MNVLGYEMALQPSPAKHAVDLMGLLATLGAEAKRLVKRLVDSTVIVSPMGEGFCSIEALNDAPSLATGFFVGDGYAVSAAHALQGPEPGHKVCLVTYEGECLEGEAISVVEELDLTFIKTSTGGPPPLQLARTLPPIGEPVVACGYAYGMLRPFITCGFVSGTEIKALIGNKEVEGLLSTSTPVIEGMSGGPMVNLSGSVIGVVLSRLPQYNEFALALPATRLLYAFRILQKYGYVKRIKLRAKLVSYLGALKKLKVGEGLVVAELFEGSPLISCGIKQGDVLLRLNSKPLFSLEDLREALDEALLNGDGVLEVEYLSAEEGRTRRCSLVLR